MKYREFWLDAIPHSENGEDVYDAYLSKEQPGDIHVIDYAAYADAHQEIINQAKTVMLYGNERDKTAAENNALKAELEIAKANSLPSFHVSVPSDEWYDITKQHTDLLKLCEEMAAALEYYSRHNHWLKSTAPNFAAEALDKYRKFKEGL